MRRRAHGAKRKALGKRFEAGGGIYKAQGLRLA